MEAPASLQKTNSRESQPEENAVLQEFLSPDLQQLVTQLSPTESNFLYGLLMRSLDRFVRAGGSLSRAEGACFSLWRQEKFPSEKVRNPGFPLAIPENASFLLFLAEKLEELTGFSALVAPSASGIYGRRRSGRFRNESTSWCLQVSRLAEALRKKIAAENYTNDGN